MRDTTRNTTDVAAPHPAHALRVLLVEPEAVARTVLRDGIRTIAEVAAYDDFWSARAGVLDGSFDFLVTNARLGAYNGVHLVYIAGAHGVSAHSIVYTGRHDAGVACDVQDAGAFYETHDRLVVTLTAYLRGPLPRRDRRRPDGAHGLPGAVSVSGRRCWDHHVASAFS
jgi:DNA-binding NtrC family response regulator